MKIYRVVNRAGETLRATSEDEQTFYPVLSELGVEPLKFGNERLEVMRLLPPIDPPAIYGIGLNYRKHAEETGAPIPQHPVVFMKSVTSLLAANEPILLPRHLRSDEVDFEVELAVVIGCRCKNVSRNDALDYILGYTVANDISARDWQKKWGGSQWSRAKSFDTFCPLGPALVLREAVADPNDLALSLRLNGETMQQSRTNDMIFSVAEIIEFLSGSTTLEAETVILTGTPEGVGMGRKPPVYLQAGDRLEAEVERVGVLVNSVEEERL